MAETLLGPYTATLVASNAISATGSTSAITLPLLDGYAFILNVTAAGGTTETMDMALQVTPDNGTTWFDWARFAQVTTAAILQRIIIQPLQGRGEAGSATTITQAGTGAISANAPLSSKIRFTYTLSGTLPTYTFAIYVIGQPRATAV